jgi:hypothetical protein
MTKFESPSSRHRGPRGLWAIAVFGAAVASVDCRKDFEGLKPEAMPHLAPPRANPPPPIRPPQPGAYPPPAPAETADAGAAPDATAPIGTVGPDAGATDTPVAEVTAPMADAGLPEVVFGDAGRPEVQSPATGIILYLPLDEGTGAGVVEDPSDNFNVGSLQGLDLRRAWVDGRFGSAVRFPRGASASLRVSVAPSLNTIEMAVSISVWVRLSGDMNGDGIILSRRAQGPGGFIYAFGITNGLARLRINSGNGYNLDLSTGQALPKGGWVHLGVTFDKKVARLYVDGRPVAAGIYELGIPQEETPIFIGAGQLTATEMLGERFAGDVDEIVMYNRVLPQSEIASLAAGARPSLR